MTRDNVDNIVVEVSIVVVVVVDVVCVDKQRAETLLKESMSTIKNVEEKQTNLSFSLPLLFSISSSLSLSLFLSPLLSLSLSNHPSRSHRTAQIAIHAICRNSKVRPKASGIKTKKNCQRFKIRFFKNFDRFKRYQSPKQFSFKL